MSSTSERYRIVDRIGAGGLGVVYKVEDQISGEILAMKVMPRDRGIANLRSEFLALARLRHDNIVAVSDYGLTDSGHDFFTMEFVQGPPLLEAVPQVPSPTFYLLVGGVLRALAFVHSRGMVHADIKPSNILIDGAVLASDPTRAARLADFGLASAIDDPDASAARGTFPYAAPEVYAGRLDARSDLYALGVVLYEMATGAKPYGGRNVREVLAAQRRGPPEDLRTRGLDLPPELAELVTALLDPVPGARPQTADEVLSRINDIAGTDFAIDSSRPLVDLSGVLVGRDRDFDELDRAWRDAMAGRGTAILVCGEEGIGKSRLIDELKLKVQLEGGHAFAAEVASDQRTPYAGISQLVRGLLPSLSGTGGEVGEWNRALAPLLGNRTESPGIDPESRFALAEAVAGVLFQVASAHPLLITLDDVHLADQATADLLAYLIRAVPDAGVLLVLGARQTSFSAAPERTAPTEADARVTQFRVAIRNAERGVRLDLPPLDGTSVFRLVENAFGPNIATRISDELYRSTGGNPAYVTRAMEAMVEAGAIARERGAWILRDESPQIPMPPDAHELALERIARLPPSARCILRVAAVLGQRSSRRVLVEVLRDFERGDAGAGDRHSDTAEADVDAALTEAVSAHLLAVEATTGELQFLYPRVVEALQVELTPGERAAAHKRAAGVLERDVARGITVAPGALATHYLATGNHELAIKWARKAAEDHAQSYDHHGSLAWYEKLRPIATGELAAHVDERLGDLYAVLGKVDDALVSYERAYDQYADSPADHIRLARRLGDLHRRRGYGEVALELLMAALEEARHNKLPDQETLCHLQIGWVLMNRADYKAAMEHAVAGHLIARSRNDLPASVELGRLRASIVISQGTTKAAMQYLDAALGEAESINDPSLVARMLCEIGRAAIHTGDYVRAIDALEKAIPATERIGYIEQTAKSLNNLGVACYYQGDWERTRTSWERFRRLCDRIDDQSELVTGLNNLGTLYRELGQFNEALAALDRAAMVAAQTGRAHLAAMISANRGETLFRLGDLAAARECYASASAEFERIGARDDLIETKRRMCEVDIATGRITEALDRAIDAAREAKDAGTRLEEGILHRVAATALRLQGDLDSSSWFIERAREILSTMGAEYERAKVDMAAAELAAARGHTDEAEQYFNAAIERFAALGARWDLKLARSRKQALVPSQSGFGLGLAPERGGGASASAGRAGLELLLGMTQALANVEIERLLEIALDKIVELTNFERGFILLLDQEGRPRERLRRARSGSKGFERAEAEFSGTIVRRVAGSGEAAMVTDISQEQDLREQKSVVALGLRQIMCAPMRSHGRVIGVLYVDSRRLTFDEHRIDLVLLEAVAAQIALAVENARLASADRQRAELMAILAHEIRNPLAGIIGYADMGETGDPADIGLETTDVFKRIRSDAERLRRLVDNVLELTRHESGNVDWSMRSFDMDELIANVIDSNHPVCEHKRITVDQVKGEIETPAFGNADRIMQVLSNLIGNAIKFTPTNGTITVAARTELVAASDPDAPPMPATEIDAWLPMELDDGVTREYVRVDVTDTGPGMSEELRGRLFEKFAQGSGKRRTSGLGLGLFISREIILRHGGTIWVESEQGKGATFSFRIPVAMAS